MRPLLAALVLIASCAHVPADRAKFGGRRDIDAQERATARLDVWCFDAPASYAIGAVSVGAQGGSSVAVDATHMLTAAHVVDCPTGHAIVYATFYGGQRVRLSVDRTDVPADLARLTVADDSTLPVLRPIIGGLTTGDTVCTSPAFPERVRQCGTVRTITSGQFDHTAVTVGGNSGAGIYSNGMLVGIVTHRYTHVDGTACAECGGRGTALGERSGWVP